MPDLSFLPALRALPPGLLTRAVLLCLLLVPVTLVLMALDRRVLDDETLWLKPLKFQLSLALHGATILAIIALLPRDLQGSLAVRVVTLGVGATVIYEVLFLGLQAARGVRSHFDRDTLFDAWGGLIMAGGAGVLTPLPMVLAPVLLWALFRGRPEGGSAPLLLACALGLVLSGWLGAQTGGAIGANRGPFVGMAIGPYLPLTGWSLSSGDLRIAHFLGLHALQALPLAGLLLAAALPARPAMAAVIGLAVLWAGAALLLLSAAQVGRGWVPPLIAT